MKNSSKCLIIGICGRSCSGKSAIARKYEAEHQGCVRVCQDRFFKKTAWNWEEPGALNNLNLIHSITKLKGGHTTHIPSKGWTEIYDCKIYPQSIVIVEGFLIFENSKLLDLFDYKIFIDVSDVNLLYRRTKRDGTSAHIDYTMNTVIPMSKKYEQTQKEKADIIIENNASFSTAYAQVCSVIQCWLETVPEKKTTRTTNANPS